MNGPPRGIARFDSSAAMAQALAASLHGRPFASLSGSPLFDALMPALNQLPRSWREQLYSFGGMAECVGAAQVHRLDLERIAAWLAGLYPQRIYPAAFVGSSNGALVHLAALLGAPWLPQTFLCPVRAFGADPDDARGGCAAGRATVDALLALDPHIAVHHVQDPNQDRLMLRTMRYFRLKWRVLPAAYRAFLQHSLRPGATLYIVACTRSWPVTRTGARSIYQFGATGGASEDEYLHGSPRVRDYLALYRRPRARWDPPAPDAVAPEAEWGFDKTLRDDLVALAQAMRWRVAELRFVEPEALSFATASLYREIYRDAGISAARLVVDSFVLLDPLTTLRLRAVPFWSMFGTEPSAALLEHFLDTQPPFDDIGLMLFSHGTDSVGMAPSARWLGLVARARRDGGGRLLGVDAARFPRDFATFARFQRSLSHAGQLAPPPPAPTPPHFEMLLRKLGPRYGVEFIERTDARGPIRMAR